MNVQAYREQTGKVVRLIRYRYQRTCEVWVVGVREYAYSIPCWSGPDL